MAVLRHSAGLFFVAAAVFGSEAKAAHCTPPTRQSTCFDADELWIPAAPSQFTGIASARTLGAGKWSVGFDATYLSRPVVLQTLSPNPVGQNVLVVDDVVDAALSAAYSPAPRVEIDAVLPAALYRTGTGLAGVTSEQGPDLPSTALRDVRIGAGYELFDATLGEHTSLAGATRLEVALPTGAAASFAGDRSLVTAPSFGLELHVERFFAAGQGGFRFREPVEIGGAHYGTEIVSAMGVGIDVLGNGLLDLALEGWILPTTLSQSRTFPDGSDVVGTLVPAEWMLSVQTRVEHFLLGIGGGSAIPLSTQNALAPNGTISASNYAGVTSPQFRFALVLRYEIEPEK